MSVTTTQYIRKPLYVSAVRVSGGALEEIARWCQGDIEEDEVPGKGTYKKYIRVRVHNPKTPRQTKAFVGDWILYTERGYKVYTNRAFHASFDEVMTNGASSTNGEVAIEETQDERALDGSTLQTVDAEAEAAKKTVVS